MLECSRAQCPGGAKHLVVFVTQQFPEGRFGPQVVATLAAGGIDSREGGHHGAATGTHALDKKTKRRAGHRRVIRPTQDASRAQVQPCQLSVGVQHLLEVRLLPAWIDGIAEKPATEVIVQPTPGHGIERCHKHFTHRRLSMALVAFQQVLELGHVRKPGLTTETALHGIGQAKRHLLEGLAQHRYRPGIHAFGAVGKVRRNLGTGEGNEPPRVFAPQRRELFQQLLELGWRPVQHCIKGIALGGDKHVEWPAAAPLRLLHEVHQRAVKRRLQLAIDLDWQIVAVE